MEIILKENWLGKEVLWVWLTPYFGLSYKPKRIYGQWRLHLGFLVIWGGMLH